MYHIISQYAKGIFNAAFAAVILNVYLGLFLEEKKRRWMNCLYWLPFLAWHVVWIWMMQNHLRFPNTVNLFINLICINILVLNNYRDHIFRKIGFSIAYLGIDVLAEILVWFILSSIYSSGKLQTLWWGSIVSRGMTICAILILHHFFKNKGDLQRDERYNGYLLFVSLGSIFVVHTLFEAYEQQGTGISLFYAVLSGMVMVGVNALVFLIHYNTCNILELRKQNEFFEYQLDLYSRHQKEQEENFQAIRRMRHDLRKDLLYIKELNLHNHGTELSHFLDERLDTVDKESKAVIHTNNLAVDALMNDKYRSALKSGIVFLTDIRIPPDLPFEGADLAILLGNLLDNAQEASERCESDRRFISVNMYFDARNLIIQIENGYDDTTLKNEAGKYKTRKKDVRNHGIGMDSIERVIEKYHGTIAISEEKHIFRTNIILYGKHDRKAEESA